MRITKPKSAVVAMALAAMLSLAACSRGPSDSAIASDVKAKFFSDPQLKSASINVAVKDGVVTLSGEAPSSDARYLAFRLANESAGVKKVDDQMTVAVAQAEPPAPEPEPAPAPKRAAPKPATPAPQPKVEPPPPPPPAAQAATTTPAAPAPEPAPQPVEVTIPAGTELTVRMIDSVDSEKHKTGQVFRASLDSPVVVDGETVVPAGIDVFVRLAEAKTAGRMAGRSELHLELARMVYQGKSYNLTSSTYDEVGKSRGKDTAVKVGGGAAIGAAIGAIAGGGKGAAIGAAVGAGAGTGIQVLTKGQQVRIPSETALEFRLEAPVDIKYMPGQDSSRRR